MLQTLQAMVSFAIKTFEAHLHPSFWKKVDKYRHFVTVDLQFQLNLPSPCVPACRSFHVRPRIIHSDLLRVLVTP